MQVNVVFLCCCSYSVYVVRCIGDYLLILQRQTGKLSVLFYDFQVPGDSIVYVPDQKRSGPRCFLSSSEGLDVTLGVPVRLDIKLGVPVRLKDKVHH